jgi:hypothetical protein
MTEYEPLGCHPGPDAAPGLPAARRFAGPGDDDDEDEVPIGDPPDDEDGDGQDDDEDDDEDDDDEEPWQVRGLLQRSIARARASRHNVGRATTPHRRIDRRRTRRAVR